MDSNKVQLSLQRALRQFKNLNTGVRKAEIFLTDFENKIKKLSTNNETEFYFVNYFNGKKYWFEKENISKIEELLKETMLIFFFEKNHIIHSHDYVLSSVNIKNNFNMFTSNLDMILRFKTNIYDEKKLIVQNAVILTMSKYHPKKDREFFSFLGENIVNYCIISNIEYSLREKFVMLAKDVLSDVTILEDLVDKILGLKISNLELVKYISFKLNENFFRVKYKFTTLFEEDLVECFNEELYVRYIFETKNKVGIKNDEISNLVLPNLSSAENCSIKFKIDMEKQIIPKLHKLNKIRLKEDISYMEKFYKLRGLEYFDAKLFAERDIDDIRQAYRKYIFDFSSARRLSYEDELNFRDMDVHHLLIFQGEFLYAGRLELLLQKIFLKKIFFQEKLFRNIVMSSFPFFFLSLKDKKDIWYIEKLKWF